MASMVSFVKNQKIQNPDEVLSSRGQERQEYMIKYVAYMAKKKCNTQTLSTSSSHDMKTGAFVEYHRWSKHQMEQAVGTEKARGWIASGRLSAKPDRITGSTDPECLEYLVPIAWTRETDESTTGLAWKGEGTGNAEALEHVQSVMLGRNEDGEGEPADGKEEEGQPAGGKEEKPGVLVKKEKTDVDADDLQKQVANYFSFFVVALF